jgi:hypothetical protein
MSVYFEYLSINFIIVVYQTLGHEAFKMALLLQKEKTQKKITILHSIYNILPLIAVKVNLSNNTIKELNKCSQKILNSSDAIPIVNSLLD